MFRLNKHGGKRKGSGRPRVYSRTFRINMTQEHHTQITELMSMCGVVTKSEMMRLAIEWAHAELVGDKNSENCIKKLQERTLDSIKNQLDDLEQAATK